MTNQIPKEIATAIDKMATHLAVQRAQSKGPTGECLYRGPQDLQCAVGCLVSDEAYVEDDEPEDQSPIDLSLRAPHMWDELRKYKPADGGEQVFIEFLAAAQRYHDAEEGDYSDEFYQNDLDTHANKSDEELAELIRERLNDIWEGTVNG